jgi:hypothetical protein
MRVLTFLLLSTEYVLSLFAAAKISSFDSGYRLLPHELSPETGERDKFFFVLLALFWYSIQRSSLNDLNGLNGLNDWNQFFFSFSQP